ncbi:amino acid adenylation domain-containing protein [Brevibacillus agri]|uniref:hybrid non-ribosomal peptide synthetase/type I polyketide synthase n=1 Tax=Brevibacillus agri TaxID=51101 RepID=UPI003D1BA77D
MTSYIDSYNGTEIAIIGMAGRFPGAKDIDEFWHNLKIGIESISFFPKEKLIANGIDPKVVELPNYVKAKGVLQDADLFDAIFFGFSPREAELLDPQLRVFLECSWEAMEKAGYVPDNYPGLIGVYAGSSQNSYLLNNLLSRYSFEELENLGITPIHGGNDFLATMVSYKLNLKGPSMMIQTACSSSLVAVHQACQSLLTGECDLALAGGVSIDVPIEKGYLYQEMGIKSPDGHCRAFDEEARGTVGGNGVGIVVLKRLNDAIADKDYIHAIIKGTAVNNDGYNKIGFTAPSIEGQARAITEALRMADVEPESITYIETHGTGTQLGDPIEIAALKQAFKDVDKRNHCAIGSLKTNIGHLDAAAGIAGLIKAGLSLENKIIPPSLNFSKPNPKIDFANSPFYVNTTPGDWKGNGVFRAGVSSFGMGGTNAHVILEESPFPKKSSIFKPNQLLVLSAKSESALEKATERLIEYCKANPDLNLADVCYTHQVGRREWKYRKAVISKNLTDMVEALETNDPNKVFTKYYQTKQSIIFMFPGQGSQYVNMGKDLYQNERVFRDEVNRCAEILKCNFGLDIIEVLFPPEEKAAEAIEEINQTAMTQPILFTIEYALAKLWEWWGVKPEAFIGHSLGEYVAACLSGTISLEDALSLVTIRGKLMQGMEPGMMMAVLLPEEQVRSLLIQKPALSLAAVNSPTLCIVAGPVNEIEKCKKEFEEINVDCRVLRTSHAFHSKMVEPVIPSFIDELKKIKWNSPKIPWISNVTGNWITNEQATDPNYWAEHLRQTVFFSKGITKLLEENKERLFLEVGPGESLSTLVRQNRGHSTESTVCASLPYTANKSASDLWIIQGTLGKLWLNSVNINWNNYWGNETPQRIPLPSYPFERKRYWIEGVVTNKQGNTLEHVASSNKDLFEEDIPETVNLTYSRPNVSTSYVSPRNEVEQRISDIWKDLLGIDTIGVYDSFFELGGHSLMGIHLISKLRQSFGVNLELHFLVQNPTISEIAKNIQKETQKVTQEVIELPELVPDPQNRYELFPMTDLASGYLIGRSDAFEFGKVGSHVYFEIETMHLDVERFENAFNRLIDRHDMLKTVILPEGQQRTYPNVSHYHIKINDLRGFPTEVVSSKLLEIRSEIAYVIPDPSKWPLFEVQVFVMDSDKFRIHARLDYLIVDALSIAILNREWKELYRDPKSKLEPLEITYRDYILQTIKLKEHEIYRKSKEYWLNRISDFPPPPPLPTNSAEVAVLNPRLVSLSGKLDSNAWSKLKAKASKANITPSGVFCAAFAEVLQKWSNKSRFTINLPIFNRIPFHEQVNKIVGTFTSTLLLEVDLTKGTTFEERARAIQEQLLWDLEHSYFSGVSVIREKNRLFNEGTRAVMPIVFTGFVSQVDTKQNWFFLDWLGKEVYCSNQTPQTLLDHQISEQEDGSIVFKWDIMENAFPEGVIQDMFSAYSSLINRLANEDEIWADQHPVSLPLKQIELVKGVNDTDKPIKEELLHELIYKRVLQHPNQLSVISSEKRLTYKQLYDYGNGIGNLLRGQGAEPNTLVAVVMEKGWEQAVAILGILQSGAAYLPIDPALPQERIHYLLENAEVKLVLTQPWLEEKIRWPSFVRTFTVCDSVLETLPKKHLPTVQSPNDLAYVIYTSGSTGHPKGVMIDHKGAVNTIVDINNRFNIGMTDRVLALSGLHFDLSVYDFLGMLAVGGTIVIPKASMERDPQHWIELIQNENVTVWNTVPALMSIMLEYESRNLDRAPSSLRLILLSGDWIPLSLPNRLRSTFPQVQMISLGGATEASIWSILYPISSGLTDFKSIPYGRPMDNQRFYVLDDQLEICPVYVPGELYIGGIGLAKGYWRDEEKTNKCFITHPHTGERLYKTGDLGRLMPDGNIEFLGRDDFQVKIRGYRVELGEIEAVLRKHPATEEVIVSANEDSPGEKRLVAYFTLRDQQPTDQLRTELIELAKKHLPGYMVPSAIMFMEQLPLTPNGKIDRKALPAVAYTQQQKPKDYVAPRTLIEQLLCDIWSEILGVDPVGIYDDFFGIGGDSLFAIRIITRIRESLQVDLSIRSIFETTTVAELATAIETILIKDEDHVSEIFQLLESLSQLSEEEVDRLIKEKSKAKSK